MTSDQRARLRATLARMSDGEREALIETVAVLVAEVVGRLSSSATGNASVTTADASLAGVRDVAFSGAVLVEDDVLRACDARATQLTVAAATIVSPLALDTARERGLTIERER